MTIGLLMPLRIQVSLVYSNYRLSLYIYNQVVYNYSYHLLICRVLTLSYQSVITLYLTKTLLSILREQSYDNSLACKWTYMDMDMDKRYNQK